MWSRLAAFAVMASALPVLAVPTAQAQMACETRTATVYFESGSAVLNVQSVAMIDRMVEDAKACGGARILVKASNEMRSRALAETLARRGVRAMLTPVSPTAIAVSTGESMQSRSATLQIQAGGERIG